MIIELCVHVLPDKVKAKAPNLLENAISIISAEF
jgi:hypothetical protein